MATEWGTRVLASVADAKPIDKDAFWEQVSNHDPEEPIRGFDKEGNPLPGHNEAGNPEKGFKPWPGSRPVEKEYYPGALPSSDPEKMGALRDSLYQDAEDLIGSDPRFEGLIPGEGEPASGGAGGGVAPPPTEEPENFQPWPEVVPQEVEEKPGYLSNIARLAGQRGLHLIGSTIRGVGELGDDLNNYMGMGTFVWGDGNGFRYVDAEEFAELNKHGVSENLLTETLPMAFQDRDLGGEKTSDPERIKEGWANGDAGEVAAATGTFIAETFTESVPDMIAAIWAMPFYVLGRSEEVAEERVRNERVSEILASEMSGLSEEEFMDPEKRAALNARANAAATGYVQSDELDTGDLTKAAPFAMLSALLERIGAKGITSAGDNIAQSVAKEVATEATEHGLKYVLKEGGQAGFKEGSTELFQEGVIEYFGEKFNTSSEGLFANMSVAEGAERGAWAALAGTGGGTAAGTTTAGVKSLFGSDGNYDIDPETGKPVPRDDGGSDAETTDGGISQAEREALEGALDQQADEAAQQSSLDLPTPAPQQDQATTPTQTSNEPAPVAVGPEPTQAPDTPTAEPVSDIEAQLNDMLAGNRDAVYLSPEQQLSPDLNIDLGEAQVIENFDGKGGTLIAKNAAVAEGAQQAKNAGAGMQDIIGHLTRAGQGKPAQGLVVQLRDADGNVARESMVATAEEAAALQAEWGDGAVVVSTEEVLARREEGVAADEAAAVENPMIQEKEVVKGFRELNKRIKGGRGVTKAFRELGVAIASVFPNAKNLPALKGSIGAPRIGKYFAALDEEISIDEKLPNLKGFLAEVMASPDEATAVQNLNRLKDYIASSGAGINTEGAQGTIAQQGAQAISQYDVVEGERLAGEHEYNFKTKKVDKEGEPIYEKRTRISGPLNRLPARAGVVANLATMVKKLAIEADKAGIEISAETMSLVERATRYLEKSMVAKPVTQKSGTSIGTVSTPQEFRGKNLDEVGGKLRAIAETLTKELAAIDKTTTTETSTVAKKPDAKAKPAPTPAVTEAPAKPSAAQKAKTASKKRTQKKAASQKPQAKGPSIASLRKRAKDLGISAAGSKVAIAERIAEVEADPAAAEKYLTKAGKEAARVAADIKKGEAELKAAAGPTVTTKKEKLAKAAKETSKPPTADPAVKANTDPDVKANMDKLLDFAGHVLSKAPAAFKKKALKNFVSHFRNVGHGVKHLSPKALETIAKVLNVEIKPSVDETITDMMVAAHKLQKGFRTEKETVRGANPDNVLEAAPVELTRGRGISALVEKLGFPPGTSLTEALGSIGLSKGDAEIFKGVVNAVPDQAQYQILDAVKEYQTTGDDIRFLAQLAEAAGKAELSSKQQLASLNFTSGLLQFTQGATKAELAEDAEIADREAQQEGYESAAEKAAYEDDTGWGSVYEESDGMHYEELRQLVDNLSRATNHRDLTALESLKEVLAPIFEAITHTASFLEGASADQNISMNDVLDLVIDNLPTNNRFHSLAVQLRKLNLNVPVHFFTESSQFGSSENVTGKFFWDEADNDTIIAVTAKPDSFARQMLTIFHEMIHAASSLKYHGDRPFHEYTNELHRQALSHLPKNFSDPKWRIKAQSAVNRAIEAGLETVEATNIIEEFLLDASKNANRELMKFSPATFYGLFNPKEFLAEASTNPMFQAYLSQNRIVLTKAIMKGRIGGPRRPSLMSSFVNAIQQMVLRISPRNNILKEVMFLNARDLMSQKEANQFYSTARTRQRESIRRSYNKMHGIKTGRRTDPEADANIKLKTTAYDRGTNKVEVTGRYEFDSTEEAGKKFRELRAAGKQNVTIRGTDRETIKSWMKGDESKQLPPEQEQTRNQTLDAQRNAKVSVGEQGRSRVKQAKAAGKAGHLAVSGRDAIERDNRSLFDKAAKKLGIANPLSAFNDAKNHAQTLARKFEKRAHNILKSFRDISKQGRALIEVQMRDITLGNIDPSQPLNSAANAHIWTKPEQNPKPRKKKDGTWYTPKAKKPQIRKEFLENAKRARDGWLAFKARHPKAAALLQKMAKLTKELHDTKVSYALEALGEAFGFDTATNAALGKAKTAADIDAIIDPNEVEQLTAQLEGKDDLVGLTKDEKKDLKKKITVAEARHAAASSAKTILHESSIKGWYFPLRRYGDYVVSTGPDVTGRDRYVSFHETQVEAERVANEINAQSSDENQVGVSLKLETTSHTADVKSVLSDLKRRIKDPETGAKLDGALSEILAANASYQSQVKRHNVDGAASNDMARGFEEYVQVSKYTLGDIRMAHRVSAAIKDMNLVATDFADSGLTNDERIQAGRVKDEITKRNKAEGGDRKKSRFQKIVGTIGFLNFLGAPSYWALNATQTYVVTLPYIMAKYGEAKGFAALLKAQAQVVRAASAAMKSNDKSYEGFKKQLSPDARRIVEALEGDNILQSTIAHEFGDLMDPRGFKKMRDNAMLAPVGKTAELAMTVMEKVPEGIEHFNRISTALAVYSLSDGDYVATRDAVNETQMNYDTNNRARLLKSFPGDTAGTSTPYVTPIMMFKTFGVGMAKLYYGAIFDAVYKKGGRAEALKLAGYLMATHTLFGGVAGGLMVAPIQLAIWALNQTLEPDDEWKLEDAAAAAGQELAGDWGATAMERGLPAAMLGVDMSRSINLGNLIWMGDDRLDYTEYGDIEQGVFSLLGPVAQYGAGVGREGLRVLKDDPRAGMSEFIQAAFPVKMGSGITEALRYEREGMRTSNELEMIPKDEWEGFLRTAFGFQTAQKAEAKDAYYSDMRLEMRRSARKNDLVKHANKAVMNNDWERLDKIINDMQSYNLSVPKAQYRVSSGDMARLRSRRRTAQREYDRKYRYAN